mgnify:CR=1 FL=1
MKNTLALVAIAGFAAAATAGNETFSLSISGAPATVDATGGATITVDVIGDSSFGTHLLGGEFGLTTGSNSMVTDIRWMNAAWSTANGNDGYDGAGNNLPIIFGQLVVLTDLFDFLPGAGSELGGVIGSFQIDIAAGSAGILDLDFTTTDRFALKTVDVDEVARTTASMDSSNGVLSLNGASIEVTPAPSALALLGLGGIAAGRRRR